MRLDNSTTTGITNMRGVFGADVVTQIRDWATSTFTDDLLPASNATYQEPSWNNRAIFSSSTTGYPLQIVPLVESASTNVQLVGGGVAYFRFTVPAGSQASIDWSGPGGTPVSPVVRWTLVRTR
jgi:hypothetical protein